MEKLYCPECGNYLEGGDGSMVDCHCGWKQERSLSSDEDEIEQLLQRVQELEKDCDEYHQVAVNHIHANEKLIAERDKATQYWQIAEGRCDALMKQRDELLAALILASCCLEPNTSSATVNQIEAAIASVKEK